MYEEIQASKELIYVLNCSRRLGKTTTLALIALELAIQRPKSHIHFGAPQQNQVKDYLLPVFAPLLESCPEDLRPTWKSFGSKWVFPNGSFIKLYGCNNKQYDNLRGNKSDFFIIDETRDVTDLEIIIKDVALPQLLSSKNPNKRIILASTPPTTPDHPFKKYAETAKAKGAYSKHTIHESWYPKDEIERLAQELGGWKSTSAQRELLAEFVTDERLHIIPEWKTTSETVQDLPKDDYFQFYFKLEGLDIGYRDFTAWLMGYYDFQHSRLVIEFEHAVRENDFTTDALADSIKGYENEYYRTNPTRPRRIADNNNLNLLADLSRLHSLSFAPVQKKSGKSDQSAKEWMVNQARQFIKAGKLVLHPRVKMLLASLEFGIWKEGHTDFARSEELGHYDFLDALIYIIAYLVPTIQNINPIPPLYGLNVATTMFPNNQIPKQYPNPQDEVIKKLFLR